MKQIENLEVLDHLIFARVTSHFYVFQTDTIPNCLKIGDIYRPVSVRRNEWKQNFPDLSKNTSKSLLSTMLISRKTVMQACKNESPTRWWICCLKHNCAHRLKQKKLLLDIASKAGEYTVALAKWLHALGFTTEHIKENLGQKKSFAEITLK